MSEQSPGQNTFLPLVPRETSFPKLLECEQQTSGIQFGVDQVPSSNGAVRVAAGYRRVLDNDQKDQPGQDYAAVQYDQNFVVGVVADGVGQSFYGDVAAKWVGKWLLEKLWDRRTNPYEEKDLGKLLLEQQGACEEQLKSKSFAHLAAPMQKALESKRGEGSQAVFVAFIWNVSNRQMVLYQVGDAIAIVYREGEPPEEVEGALANGRWSTAGRSQLYLRRFTYPKKNITGIAIKSDGAEPSWGLSPDRETTTPDEFCNMASRMAERDDVSFVTAFFARPLPPPEKPAPLQHKEALYGQPVEVRQPGRSWDAQTPGRRAPLVPDSVRGSLGNGKQNQLGKSERQSNSGYAQIPQAQQLPLTRGDATYEPRPRNKKPWQLVFWLMLPLVLALGLVVGYFARGRFNASESSPEVARPTGGRRENSAPIINNAASQETVATRSQGIPSQAVDDRSKVTVIITAQDPSVCCNVFASRITGPIQPTYFGVYEFKVAHGTSFPYGLQRLDGEKIQWENYPLNPNDSEITISIPTPPR